MYLRVKYYFNYRWVREEGGGRREEGGGRREEGGGRREEGGGTVREQECVGEAA